MMNVQSEVRSPHAAELADHLYRSPAAEGVRRAVDRPPDAKNNVVALAKAARAFNSPTTITTVETQNFSGYTYLELRDVFPDKPVLERMSMNSWDDKKVRDARKANKRNKVVPIALEDLS